MRIEGEPHFHGSDIEDLTKDAQLLEEPKVEMRGVAKDTEPPEDRAVRTEEMIRQRQEQEQEQERQERVAISEIRDEIELGPKEQIPHVPETVSRIHTGRNTAPDLYTQYQLEGTSHREITDPEADARSLRGKELAQYIEKKFGVKIGPNGDVEGNFLSKNKRLDKYLLKNEPNYRDLRNSLQQDLKTYTPSIPKAKSRLRQWGEALGFIAAGSAATAGIGLSLERRNLDDEAQKGSQQMAQHLDTEALQQLQQEGPNLVIPQDTNMSVLNKETGLREPYQKIDGMDIFGNAVDFTQLKGFFSQAPEGQLETIPLTEFIKMDVTKIKGESYAIVRGVSPDNRQSETIRAFHLKNGTLENVPVQQVQNLITINSIRPMKIEPITAADFKLGTRENVETVPYTAPDLEPGNAVGLSSDELESHIQPGLIKEKPTGISYIDNQLPKDTTPEERIAAAKKGVENPDTIATLDSLLKNKDVIAKK